MTEEGYIAGLQVSELVGLRWRNFTPGNLTGQISVVGKGDKSRHILLPQYLWQELMDYRRDALKDAYVFKRRKGKDKPLPAPYL
ncbi:hypothetical protein [Nostoc sp.]|uniref:hypothetical protein n=1 Tax=Nostoc sp. TaxID=1180 RepID=UPI002FF9DE34